MFPVTGHLNTVRPYNGCFHLMQISSSLVTGKTLIGVQVNCYRSPSCSTKLLTMQIQISMAEVFLYLVI